MGKQVKSHPHLDRDPNDPRLNTPATPNLSNLNDEPEAPVVKVEVVETESERTVEPDALRTQPWSKSETMTDSVRLGADPNDARLVGEVENTSLAEGKDGSTVGGQVDVDINNPEHGGKTFDELKA